MVADVAAEPVRGNHTIFLSGPAGSGKTTLAVRRLSHLLRQGVPAEQILILVSQRALAAPYLAFLTSAEPPPGPQVDIATIGGLARRTIELFWPLIARSAGFADPRRPPRFLTLETAQYFMERVVEPFLRQGAFDGVSLPRPRLASQLIDNLNKAAAVGFPPEEIASRLKGAWAGESSRLRIYDQVQETALAFRRACLEQSLLDWSLQLEIFWHHLLPLPQVRRYLLSGYRHIIADNVEEDIPATHDLLRLWLPICDSALLVCDSDGGFRVFLGADPEGAAALRQHCRRHVILSEPRVAAPQVLALGEELVASLSGHEPASSVEAHSALVFPPETSRFYPQMLDWVADQVSRLVLEEGLAPAEIALLAPFVSDSLRFLLVDRLGRYGISVRTHRPSRELSEEPAARCLLTLAKLAHPGWRRPPPAFDVAQALCRAIADLDPVRARLLTDIVYRIQDGKPILSPFHQIIAPTQQRISYLLGLRYVELHQWLQTYGETGADPPSEDRLDVFWSRLFGEVLSRSGFGFHRDLGAGAVAANLIESVRKFRRVVHPLGLEPEVDPDLEYVDLVEGGLLAAQYVSTWPDSGTGAVLLLPAYTYLMMNRPVAVQFWLDAGSLAWYERIFQPLTHPHVLRRGWGPDRQWLDEDEVQVRQEALSRLILGLTRRCRQRIYLCYSVLNEQGFEQRGPLLQSVQRVLRRGRRSIE